MPWGPLWGRLSGGLLHFQAFQRAGKLTHYPDFDGL